MSSTTIVKTSRKRQSLQPNQVNIQQTKGMGGIRMSMGGTMGGTSTMRRNVMSSMPMERGQIAAKTSQAVRGVVQEKDKEKREMGDLNQKLASYIETRKYNESQINALKDAIEKLKNLKIPVWEDIRADYVDELTSYSEALQETKNSLAELQAENTKLKEDAMNKDEELDMLRGQNAELENRLKSLSEVIGTLEGDVASLRRELENSSLSNAHLKQDNERLRAEIQRLTCDLEGARCEQIRAFNLLDQEKAEQQLLEDTLMKENDILKAQVKALREAEPDYRKYFTSGFKDAVAEMQKQNDQIMADTVGKLEAQYEAKMVSLEHQRRPDNVDSTAVRSENKTLKSQINSHSEQLNRLNLMLEELRRRNEDLMKQNEDDAEEHRAEVQDLREQIMRLQEELTENDAEVDKLTASKIDLELEISTYRKLLDCEQNSMRSALERSGNIQSEGGAFMANMIMSSGGGSGGGSSSSASQNSNPDVSKPTKKSPSPGQPQKPKQPKTAISQTTGKVNLKKTSRGSLQFSDVPTNGEYVELENQGKSEIDLSGYQIVRNHTKGTSSYKFSSNTKLPAYKKCRVYGNAFDQEAVMDAKKLGFECFVADKRNCNNWGCGNGEFKLLDASEVQKATATLVFT